MTKHTKPDHARLDRVVAEARLQRELRESGYRERALKLFPWICARCGREFSGVRLRELTVHHKDHNHDNNPPDGSNWGDQYLSDFYHTMDSKYADKIIVGGAWSGFNDVKASWGLNRHISARCGQTYTDTLNFWRGYFPADSPPPFIMVETWNDHEEGTAIEDGLPKCATSVQEHPLAPSSGQSQTPRNSH